MESKTAIGREGEKLAAEYLVRKGYRIAALNWKKWYKEIDLVAWDGDTLVIVEVKMRKYDSFGHPSEFVSRRKQSFLVQAAELYLDTIEGMPSVRFDVVAILGDLESYDLEHIEDAFTP